VNRHECSEESQVLTQCNSVGKLLKISLGKSCLTDFPWSRSMDYMMKLGISSEKVKGI